MIDNIRVEPFSEEHAKQLSVPEHLSGGAMAVMEGSTVLGVVGAREAGGLVEVWMVLSEEAKARPLALCRVAKRFVADLVLEHGQIGARASSKADRRWIEYLGFVFDNGIGILRA